MKFRTLLVGLWLGAALSVVRAPLGLDPASVAAVSAADSALFRAGALAAGAFAFLPACRLFAAGVDAAWLLVGAVLGFAQLALFSGTERVPGSSLEGAGVIALVAVGAVALARRLDRRTEPALATPAKPALLGWVLCGLGVSTALEATARPLRLLGGARAADDGVLGLALLVWVALGAVAFTPLLARRVWAPALAAVLGCLAAASCLEPLAFLGEVSDRDGLEHFVQRFGLGLSEQGMLSWDALVGARGFALPGLCLGAGLAALRSRASWLALWVGAALGTLAFPSLVRAGVAGLPTSADPLEALREFGLQPGLRVAIAASVAALGAGLVLLGSRTLSSTARGLLATLVLIAALACWALPRRPALPISPWLRFPIVPEFVRELPEGILTVEPAQGPSTVVTLDRRRLTPLAAEQPGEDAQLLAALALSSLPQPRVLLVGPLTPARWVLLRSRGIQTVQRVWVGAAFSREIEGLLLGDLPAFAGESATPEQGKRLARSADLLVAPAVEGGGSAGLPEALEDFAGPAVVWIRALDNAAERHWGGEVLLSMGRFEDLAIGLVRGGVSQARARYPAGESPGRQGAWKRLRLRAQERDFEALRRCGARLAEAARDTPLASCCMALAGLLDAQVRSSPYESPAQAVELPDAASAAMRDAALAVAPGGLGSFERGLVEFVGRTLARKREVEALLEVIAPIAERHAAWPALEREVARADWELLDYTAVAARLELAVGEAPHDLGLGIWRAEALLRAGKAAESAKAWEALLQVQPGRTDLLRWRALALARAGDPRARGALQDALAVSPDDSLLRSHLDLTGPPPPLPPPVAGSLPGEAPPAH